MSPDWPFKAAEHNGYCCPNAQYIAVKLTIEEYEYAALAVKERDFLSKQVNELGSNLILMEFDKKQVEKELAEMKASHATLDCDSGNLNLLDKMNHTFPRKASDHDGAYTNPQFGICTTVVIPVAQFQTLLDSYHELSEMRERVKNSTLTIDDLTNKLNEASLDPVIKELPDSEGWWWHWNYSGWNPVNFIKLKGCDGIRQNDASCCGIPKKGYWIKIETPFALSASQWH